jgi:hypothetical protein
VIDGGGEGINILGKDNLQASGTLKNADHQEQPADEHRARTRL